MVWLQLMACILIILFFGRKVARYGDIIAVKTGLGGLWIGLVLISITTSLPELFNGVSAIYIVDKPDLTVGNLLGANAFNLLNLAFLDVACSTQCLVNMVSRGARLSAWFSLAMVGAVTLSIFLQQLWNFSLGWVGWTTPIIIILYLVFIRQIFINEKRNSPAETLVETYDHISLNRTFLSFVVSALFIIGAGIWLALIGDQISAATGLGENFIGSLLIGLTTTLPEITVSYSALRIGAVELAVSNMIGSNMFNMFLICIDDLMYTKGAILGVVSPNNILTGVIVIVMTVITLAAMYFGARKLARLSWFTLSIIIVFLIGAYLSFILNN